MGALRAPTPVSSVPLAVMLVAREKEGHRGGLLLPPVPPGKNLGIGVAKKVESLGEMCIPSGAAGGLRITSAVIS